MPKSFSQLARLIGSGCGGAVLGALLVGILATYLGRHQLGADSRVGLAYALFLGVPLGIYFALRVAPAIDAKWRKLRAAKRRPGGEVPKAKRHGFQRGEEGADGV